VPMLTFVRHLTLINANWVPTGVTILGVHRFKATATEWTAVSHDVSLASKLRVAFEAAEMPHVPTTAFGFGAFVREDDLVTRSTARLQDLCMVSSAENVAIFVKVDKVDEELVAGEADEAGGVPAGAGARARRPHRDVATADTVAAVNASRARHRQRVGPNGSSSQGLLLALGGEEAKLPAFLLRQGVAVARLVVVRRKLLQQLLDAVFLPDAIHVRNLVLGERAKILMDFFDVESRRNPSVFLQGAARVIVRGRVVMLRKLSQKLCVDVVQYVPRQIALFLGGGFDVVIFPRALAVATELAPVMGFEPRTFVPAVETKLTHALVQVTSGALTVIHIVESVVEFGGYGGSRERGGGGHVGRRRRQRGRRSRRTRPALG